MVEVLVGDFLEKVQEILPGVELTNTITGYVFRWKTDKRRFRIQFHITRSGTVKVDSYFYQESKPDYYAEAQSFNYVSFYELAKGSLLKPQNRLKFRIDAVPDVFTDGDAIYRFIEDVKDNGISAFADLMTRLAYEYGQSLSTE